MSLLLFRREALEAQQGQEYGLVLLARFVS